MVELAAGSPKKYTPMWKAVAAPAAVGYRIKFKALDMKFSTF